MEKRLFDLRIGIGEEVIEYIQGLGFEKEFEEKATKDILTSVKGAFTFVYLIYPLMFVDAFFDEKDKLKKERFFIELCTSSFFIYKAINKIDRIIDEKNTFDTISLFRALSYTEEGVKILTKIFGYNSSFWKFWSKRKKELAKSILLDSELNQQTKFEWGKYEILADFKSAIGKLAIDALFIKSDSELAKNNHQILIEAHKYFSIGFQIIDDIVDVKQDFLSGQANLILLLLKEELHEEKKDIQLMTPEKVSQEIFFRQISKKVLDKSHQYLLKAKKILKENDLNLPLWDEIVDLKIANVLAYKAYIDACEKKVLTKVNYSYEISEKLNITKAIDLSFDFIISNQEEDGSFCDFWGSIGISNTWTTGFVLSQLEDSNLNGSISYAVDFLLNNTKDGLWGFNSAITYDTDSTSCCLFGLSNFSKLNESSFSKWKNSQNADGSFATFTDEYLLHKLLDYSGEDDVSGWMISHDCVTAMGFLYLAQFHQKTEAFSKSLSYIIKSQNANGSWNSYWWTSPIYSTSINLQGMLNIDSPEHTDIIQKGLDFLTAKQNESGSFCDEINKDVESPFYTGLALQAFCKGALLFGKYKENADRAAKWILENQYTDGSFKPTYSLRVLSPEVNTHGFIDQSEMAVISDFTRFFSTAVCLNALTKYKKLGKTNVA